MTAKPGATESVMITEETTLGMVWCAGPVLELQLCALPRATLCAPKLRFQPFLETFFFIHQLLGFRSSCPGVKLGIPTRPRLKFHSTVRHRGMGTGISEASKRVPIFSFATQGGKQESSFCRQGSSDKTSRLRPGRLEQSLSLMSLR